MKQIKVPSKLLLAAMVLLGLFTFTFDIVRFSSTLPFERWTFINEAITLTIILVYYFYIRQKKIVSSTDISVNLKNFIGLLGGIYLWTFFLKLILPASFTGIDFPAQADNFKSLLYSNLIAIGAIGFLVPMLLILKNLIYYKQKSRTRLYVGLALISSLISIIFTIYFQQPLDIHFSGNGWFISVTTIISLTLFAILSTQNTWIIYLSRKKKYTYFLISLGLLWALTILFDYTFRDTVAAHSVGLAAFTNLSWYFLVIYTLFGSVTILFQLPTARVFDRKMREVHSLHRLGRLISAEFDLKKLVELITPMVSEVVEANYTWIEIYDEKTDQLRVAAIHSISGDENIEFNNPSLQQIGLRIIENQKSFVINNLPHNGQFQDLHHWNKTISSLAAAPLIGANGQTTGIIYAAKPQEYGFDPDDITMLEAYANQTAIALENVKLVKNSLTQERMEQELQIAREVQMRLLPQKIPAVGNLQIETLTITAYEVGGDYYDFYTHGDDTLGLIIGDVSGKGTSAAFYMAETKGIVQSITRTFDAPGEILKNINKILFDSLEKKSFITLLAARIDVNKNQLRFARAGHCPVLHYHQKTGTVSIHTPPGMAVGLNRGNLFDNLLKEEKLSLAPGDILAFFTDGLSEAMNKAGDEYGEEKLGEVIAQNARLDAEALKDIIIDSILAFVDGQNLHDDLTLVLVKYDPEIIKNQSEKDGGKNGGI